MYLFMIGCVMSVEGLVLSLYRHQSKENLLICHVSPEMSSHNCASTTLGPPCSCVYAKLFPSRNSMLLNYSISELYYVTNGLSYLRVI